MAKSNTREYKVRIDTPGPFGISCGGRIRVKETPKETKKFSIIHKSKRGVVLRRVFLVAILFQQYPKCLFRSTPMMHNGKEEGPWPLLRDNIRIFRYWLICVVDDNGNSHEWPSKSEFLEADFFDCPQQPLARTQPSGSNRMTWKLPRNIIETIEAVQELGVTKLRNDDIHHLTNAINGLWGKYYPLLWNSQQFSIRLAHLILRSKSRPQAIPVVRNLLIQLSNARKEFQRVRHLSCMGAFVGFGIATFGIGVVAAWGTAGGSLISESMAEEKVWSCMEALEEAFRPLRDIRL